MALNDFDYIKAKIRKITVRPSEFQLSDDELINYINSFLIYDLPLHTKLFYNRQKYSFQLTPNVGVYSIEAIKNDYINFEPPAYVDGFQIQYNQNEQSFLQMYPRYKYTSQISTGNGTVGPYSGSYQYTPIEPETAVISTIDINGNSLTAIDDGNGTFTGDVVVGSTIDYETGAVANLNFTTAATTGEPIYLSANNYIVGRPFAMLYFNNEFRFWPFPDKAYTFEIVAFPNLAATSSTGGGDFPELKQWADFIAYGTSLKIFTDNMDMNSYGNIKILFDEAKRLAERRTMKQLSNQRVQTIYDDGMHYPSSMWGYPYQ